MVVHNALAVPSVERTYGGSSQDQSDNHLIVSWPQRLGRLHSALGWSSVLEQHPAEQ